MDSGVHDGLTDPVAESFVAFRDVIQVPGAPWLRLQFEAYNLRENTALTADGNDSSGVESDPTAERSYITITSLEDGSKQRLDARSLPQWNNASAYFNGYAVEIELYVAAGDRGIFFAISEIMVGERVSVAGERLGKAGDIETICGGIDDRVAWNDQAVGRLTRVTATGDSIAWCTGWIGSNGAHLTAGHCFRPGDLEVLEFSVPESDPDGTPYFAEADDQYSLISGSEELHDNGLGDDWAVFDVYTNSNTTLLPVHAQGAFYRVSHDHDPDSIRATGYGVDGPAPCFGDSRQFGCTTGNPPRNSDNLTQQTHAAPSHGEDSTGTIYWFRYEADVQGVSSGGPLIVEGLALSVGIGTQHAGTRIDCPEGDYNKGTSFENDALENALNTFPGTNVEYADSGHPIPANLEDGTVFRPYDTVQEAVNEVSTGGIVSIVKGYYNETLTINTAMTITAPVGVVTIGASGPSAMIAEVPELTTTATLDTTGSLIPTSYALSPAYPNPFNPFTTIKYALKEDVRATLRVYDLLGREVRVLVNEHQPAAYHSVVWDGRDRAGRPLPSGVYIARLVAGDFVAGIKMVLLK